MSVIDLFRFKRVGEFETVSLNEFKTRMEQLVPKSIVSPGKYEEIYNNLVLPYRKTIGSAGFDFTVPFEFELKPGESIQIPTGIKCKMKLSWVLLLSVRSGCGQYRIQLDDTIPAIDSDYYNCLRNEGHIIIKITNDNREKMVIKFNKNTSFIQGFFFQYGVTYTDWRKKKKKRQGGFGSTGNQNNVGNII